MRYKEWKCPYCEQTSSRRWNLETHINRRHNGIGRTFKTQNSYYPSTSALKQPQPTNRYSGHPKAALGREDSGMSIGLDSILPMLRQQVEFSELVKKLQSSQQAVAHINFPMLLTILSSLNPTAFQTLGGKGGLLPVGYRVKICNNCLSGNGFESINDSGIELEVLIEQKHTCKADDTIQENIEQYRKRIEKAQETLIFVLKQVVAARISQRQALSSSRLCLVATEFGGHKSILEQLGNKKLPQDKSWIDEKDYIDLGKLCRTGNQTHWACRLIKERAFRKILEIGEDTLSEFIDLCKATFGVFQVQLGDKQKRYFVVSVVF